ncbi:MAG: ADP-ribosylglycohydrolase family protein [Acidobacteriota bacterium]
MHDGHEAMARAILSLEGLSIGDAFGERFFVHDDVVDGLIASRALPAAPWEFTDDTQMALSIVEILGRFDRIDQDALAASFVEHYVRPLPYGPAMRIALDRMRGGEGWRDVARGSFEGRGSYGNGAAMRVAPLGAYHAGDLPRVEKEALLSAEVTHAHPEAIAGAVAVAIAAAIAWETRADRPSPADWLRLVLPHVPASEVRRRTVLALEMIDADVAAAARTLGSGYLVSAQDTVPFALWCAARTLASYEESMWLTVSGLGDRDTTCAIAGGIVALSAPPETIPPSWRAARQPLPAWHR